MQVLKYISSTWKSKNRSTEKREEFKQVDLIRNGLIGNEDASHRRDELGKILGIGYGNAKQFLSRLNNYGVSREEFEQIVVVKDAGKTDRKNGTAESRW